MGQERVIIVVLSYSIGFLTAFIGFGLADDAADNNHFLRAELERYSSESGANQAYAGEIARVVMRDSAMYIVVDDREAVISGKLTDGMTEGPGFHVSIPFYSISPSGDFVYYCEQESTAQDTCKEYIYSVATHKTHHLKSGSESMTTDLQTNAFTWIDDNVGSYGTLTSISETEPWKLVQK